MQDIEKIRSEIDHIHIELTKLFRQRLVLAQKIWDLKKSQQAPLIDPQREEFIIHRFDQSIEHVDEQVAVQNFFRGVLDETRRFLEAKFK